MSEQAILVDKNKDMDDLNFVIQNQLTGTLHSFKSIDWVTNEDEFTNYTSEFLNSLDVPGFPLHRLQLNVLIPRILIIWLFNLNDFNFRFVLHSWWRLTNHKVNRCEFVVQNQETPCFSHGQLCVTWSLVGKPSILFDLAPNNKKRKRKTK